ncbi:hypothetical protein LguiB_013842 [Lonicera macranthoides]
MVNPEGISGVQSLALNPIVSSLSSPTVPNGSQTVIFGRKPPLFFLYISALLSFHFAFIAFPGYAAPTEGLWIYRTACHIATCSKSTVENELGKLNYA